MKLFESVWREEHQFFERYYDEDLGRSMKKRIDLPYEWYEPSSKGLYTSILDDAIKLEKKQGRAKDGRDQYGFSDPMYRHIRDTYWKKDAYNLDPHIWYLDIETRVGTCSKGFPVPEKAAEPISLFQIYDNKEDVMIVLGLREWKHESDYEFDYKVKYVKCTDEIHLIESFLNIFAKLDPLIIYAWNGSGFDYPYIYNRLKKLGIDTDRLSNHGKVKYSEGEFQGKIDFKFSADGHFWVDLMKVYKTFIKAPRPSHALDAIAEVELRENKVSHSEYAAFDDFYTGKYILPENPTENQLKSKIYQHVLKNGVDEEAKELSHSEFVFYGIKDTYLIKKIDDKLKFTSLMCMISEKMGVVFSDVLGTVKPWSQYISNTSHLDLKVTPPKKEHNDPYIVGGYVRAPNAGKHKWVMSTDVNSMYPLLGMVGFNMSPETYVPISKLPTELREYILRFFNNQDEDERFEIQEEDWNNIAELLNKHNLALGINGAVFTKDKLGMIPEMVLDIYYSRKKAKKTMFKYEQQKLLIKDILKKRTNESMQPM